MGAKTMNKDERDILIARARMTFEATENRSVLGIPYQIDWLRQTVSTLIDVVEALSEEIEHLNKNSE